MTAGLVQPVERHLGCSRSIFSNQSLVSDSVLCLFPALSPRRHPKEFIVWLWARSWLVAKTTAGTTTAPSSARRHRHSMRSTSTTARTVTTSTLKMCWWVSCRPTHSEIRWVILSLQWNIQVNRKAEIPWMTDLSTCVRVNSPNFVSIVGLFHYSESDSTIKEIPRV